MTAVEASEAVKGVSLVAAVDLCGAIADKTIESCKVGCEVGAHTCAACNISSCCVAEGILPERSKDVPAGLISTVHLTEYLGVVVCSPKEPVKVNVKPEAKVVVPEGESTLVL